MAKESDWQAFWNWWDGTPIWVVFNPDRIHHTDSLVWPNFNTGVDEEELEMLELAGRLASLKPKKH